MTEQFPDQGGEQGGEQIFTPEDLHRRIEDLMVEHAEWVRPRGETRPGTQFLLLDTAHGERLVIDQVLPGNQKPGAYVQDIMLNISPFNSTRWRGRMADFNFNQFGDGALRYRVLQSAGTDGDYTKWVPGNQADEQGHYPEATSEDIGMAMDMFEGALVVNPDTYKVVGQDED